jgi:hypothetical protein
MEKPTGFRFVVHENDFSFILMPIEKSIGKSSSS